MRPKHYALIFRSSRALTTEELKQRQVEIATWVKHVTDTGITLDPRSLGEMIAVLSAEGGKVISHSEVMDSALSTMVFFDAPDKDQAVNIAQIHPGLQYGVSVEVREWTSPRETATQV